MFILCSDHVGWSEGISMNGHNRAINREKLNADTVLAELSDPNHRRTKIWRAYRHLLSVRRNHIVFHPFGDQEILELDEHIFAVLRKSESTGQKNIVLA
jgi:glucosylglycerate phosphorylase